MKRSKVIRKAAPCKKHRWESASKSVWGTKILHGRLISTGEKVNITKTYCVRCGKTQ